MAIGYLKVKDETFGKLKFLSRDKGLDVTEGFGRNQRTTHYGYRLKSSKQAGIEVFVPIDGGVMNFDFMEEVKLLDPEVRVTGDTIQNDNGRNRGYTDWVVYADKLEKVGK